MGQRRQLGALMTPHVNIADTYVTSRYIWLASLAFGLFGGIHLVVNDMSPLGYFELITAGLMFLNGLVLLFSGNTLVARTAFLAIVFSQLVAMLISGGIGEGGIFWFIIFPVGAYFLLGRSAGTAVVSLLLVVTWICLGLEYINVLHLEYDAGHAWQMTLMVIVMSAAIYTYQRSLDSLRDKNIETQQNLSKEKIKAEAIVDNIGDAVVVTNQKGQILLLNKAGEAMFGWKQAEIFGKRFVDAIPILDEKGKRVNASKRPMLELLRGNKQLHVTTTYVRRDGSSFRGSGIGTPIRIGDKQFGAIGLIRDITKEDAVDKAKTEFVTLASHQLRTPISAIRWLCELLTSKELGELTPEQLNYLRQIELSNRRMAALVDDMLLVSSLELGNFIIRPEPTDITSIARAAVKKEYELLATEKTLHIHENYDQNLDGIWADPASIKVILQCLVSNAIKYTPDQGDITIDIRCSNIKANATCDGSIAIEVADTGYGIPLAEQKQLFSKLFRASNITAKDTDGTGLGLFIVKKILDYIGGQITFTSTENKGSTFTVLLPQINKQGKHHV